MDPTNSISQESQDTNKAASEAPAPQAAPAVTAAPTATDPGAPATDPNAPPPWEPSFKYKIGKEEKEFDPLFKDVVKSIEHEKKLRELYEKADGLDVVKMSRDQYKKHLEETSAKFGPVEKELKQLGFFLQKDDLGSAFDLLGVSKQKVIDWVAQEIQYKQMSPEERARVDAQRSLTRENFQKSEQAETLEERLAQQETDFLKFQMSVLEENPKYQSAAESFDSRVGTPGAFKQKFLDVGDYLTIRNGGKLVPPNEVFERMLKEYGLESAQATTPVVPPPQDKPVVTATPAEKPTIKSVSGSKSTTPVKSKVKTLDDIKRIQREMAGTAGNYTEGRR